QSVLRQLEDEYRLYYKTPETATDYWVAMNFGVDVGRLALAAQLLQNLLDATKNDDESLWKIEEQAGMQAILRLASIPTWVDDPTLDKAVRDKIDKQAKANIQELLDRVTRTVKAHLADPARFRRL